MSTSDPTDAAAMYPAAISHQIGEARRELVGAPLTTVAAAVTAALVDAAAGMAEIAARQRLTKSQHQQRIREIDALAACAAGHLALSDLATARRTSAHRAADDIARAFERERRDPHSPRKDCT